MADKAEAKDEDKDAKKGGSKKLLFIIIPIVLVLVGGGVAFFVLKGKPAASSATPTATKTVAHKPGPPVTLTAVTINLAGGHFLQLTMSLQPEAGATELDGAKAQDLAINLISGMSVTELSTTKGRNTVKEELVKQISEAYEKKIYDIYFTSFVMT